MNVIEKTSKTVEGAISDALKQLNLTREQVIVEVLQESSKGFLGLFAKNAVVRVTKKNDPEKVAKNFLKEMFLSMGLVVEIETKLIDKILNINLIGENIGFFIGKRGKTLDAIQYLVSLVVNKGDNSYVNVFLDTENYREKRKENLKKFALNMAKKVKTKGKKVSLEPMNSFERSIVHAALKDDEKIKTFSKGEEPFRKVIISLK